MRNWCTGANCFPIETGGICTMAGERRFSGCPELVVCGLVVFLLGMSVHQTQAGCAERDSPNCCTGRNNDCSEYTKRKTVCYCDTYCQKTGDCCEDYKRVCQISGEFAQLQYSFIFLEQVARKLEWSLVRHRQDRMGNGNSRCARVFWLRV